MQIRNRANPFLKIYIFSNFFSLKIAHKLDSLSRISLVHYLSADSEEAPSAGVHENDFAPVMGFGPVRVDSEDQVALAIIDGEAIIGEEKRGLQDGEMSFFLEYEPSFHNEALFHIFG
jgi:hypothetical protein